MEIRKDIETELPKTMESQLKMCLDKWRLKQKQKKQKQTKNKNRKKTAFLYKKGYLNDRKI